jgi:hypothetical protein
VAALVALALVLVRLLLLAPGAAALKRCRPVQPTRFARCGKATPCLWFCRQARQRLQQMH